MSYLEELSKRILVNIDIGPRVRKAHFLKLINKINISNKVILDAGCGVGEYMFDIIRKYPIKEIVGVEIQEKKVRYINKKIAALKNYNNIRVICGNLAQNRLQLNKFDFCYCIDVLEHILKDRQAITNIFYSLRDGGLFVIHVPNLKPKRFFKEFKNYHQDNHVRNGYEIKILINLLENSGFKIVNSRFTSGKLVELTWEIEKKIEKKLSRRLSQILCYPFTALSSFIDIRKQLATGNGILIVAQKPRIQQSSVNKPLIDLIVFPMHDWRKSEKEGFRTRDTHLIQHFEKNKNVNKILVIDRPITFPEMLLRRRVWKIKSGKVIKKRATTCLSQVSPKIFVYDIFSLEMLKPLILKRDWWHHIFQKESILKKIYKCVQDLNMANKVLFLWNPLSTGVIGNLEEKLIVFDALDNWTKHPEMKDRKGWIKKGYEIIKEKADIIFTNSEETQKLLENSKTHPILISNGVDAEFFQQIKENIPEDIKTIPRPIIGYAGKIAKRIDVNLLSFLASNLAQMSFVLIGQFLDKKWVAPLFKFKNIHFLGDKHYTQLPYYLKSFDICIIPHNIKSLESGGDPIKLYEYLAVGKPVVTTHIGGVDVFKDVITIANTKEEFLEGIIYWLKKIKENKTLSENLRNSLTESCSWGYKADTMINCILERINKKCN